MRHLRTKARAEHYAVPHININNLEWAKAILLAAQGANSPVIVAVSERLGDHLCGFKTVCGMVTAMVDYLDISVPVAMHLDHGSYAGAIACIEAGFSSVMFDGSALPFSENIEKTQKLVKICEERGISLEAEVGGVGGEEDSIVSQGELADPEECKMIANLGVTMLAAGIGNIHGQYPTDWQGLNFEVLKEIGERTGDLPLVLHGGTGIPDDMIKKAISLGISKINVNTECQLAFAAGLRKYIETGKDLEGKGYDPRNLLTPGVRGIMDKVREKMELFGSVGKGNNH